MKKTLITLSVALTPFITFAEQLRDINSVAKRAVDLGNLAIYVMITLSVIWIIYSTVRYIVMGGAGGEERAKGGMNILYGVIGLFLILSIWGIVNILVKSFVFETNTRPSFENISIPDPVSGGSSATKLK